mmetsp:Transcript_51121/g.123412  ORF Transcript_51121/g.123412 Transcript_51121/m.123412 type:complete len:82 (-) Transcript_51121:1718-1963(-)
MHAPCVLNNRRTPPTTHITIVNTNGPFNNSRGSPVLVMLCTSGSTIGGFVVVAGGNVGDLVVRTYYDWCSNWCSNREDGTQ